MNYSKTSEKVIQVIESSRKNLISDDGFHKLTNMFRENLDNNREADFDDIWLIIKKLKLSDDEKIAFSPQTIRKFLSNCDFQNCDGLLLLTRAHQRAIYTTNSKMIDVFWNKCQGNYAKLTSNDIGCGSQFLQDHLNPNVHKILSSLSHTQKLQSMMYILSKMCAFNLDILHPKIKSFIDDDMYVYALIACHLEELRNLNCSKSFVNDLPIEIIFEMCRLFTNMKNTVLDLIDVDKMLEYFYDHDKYIFPTNIKTLLKWYRHSKLMNQHIFGKFRDRFKKCHPEEYRLVEIFDGCLDDSMRPINNDISNLNSDDLFRLCRDIFGSDQNVKIFNFKELLMIAKKCSLTNQSNFMQILTKNQCSTMCSMCQCATCKLTRATAGISGVNFINRMLRESQSRPTQNESKCLLEQAPHQPQVIIATLTELSK